MIDGHDHRAIAGCIQQASPRCPATGGGQRRGETLHARHAFYQHFADSMDQHSELAIVLADIGVAGLATTLGRHPDRAVNVGIREQLMVSVAAGFALEGFRPVVHTYAPFLVERAFEQLKLDVSHQGVGVIATTVGASYDSATSGRTHHAPGDVALISTLPDWRAHVPGHPDEVEALLDAELAASGSAYLRLSEAVNDHAHSNLEILRHGERDMPVLLAVGPTLQPVLDGLGDAGFGVLYLSTVRPWPRLGVGDLVGDRDVILVEPYLEGTSVSQLVESVGSRRSRVAAIGVKNVELRRYGSRQDHDRAHGLDAGGLAARIGSIVGVWGSTGRSVVADKTLTGPIGTRSAS